MDGIAVRAEETYGTTERTPKTLKVGRDALWINTGQAMPEGFNAVIMVEKLHQVAQDQLEIRAPAYPWQNIRKVGEDIVATQLLLPQHHEIRPYDMGALLSAGVYDLKVRERPRVAIIPTGSELVHHRQVTGTDRLKTNQIIEYNSVILAGLVRECGAEPVVYDIVPDSEEEIRSALEKAVAQPMREDALLTGVLEATNEPYAIAQIAGALALMPGFDGVVCLPGTHSKGVHVSAGEIVSFQTATTGEMFALASDTKLNHIPYKGSAAALQARTQSGAPA